MNKIILLVLLACFLAVVNGARYEVCCGAFCGTDVCGSDTGRSGGSNGVTAAVVEEEEEEVASFETEAEVLEAETLSYESVPLSGFKSWRKRLPSGAKQDMCTTYCGWLATATGIQRSVFSGCNKGYVAYPKSLFGGCVDARTIANSPDAAEAYRKFFNICKASATSCTTNTPSHGMLAVNRAALFTVYDSARGTGLAPKSLVAIAVSPNELGPESAVFKAPGQGTNSGGPTVGPTTTHTSTPASSAPITTAPTAVTSAPITSAPITVTSAPMTTAPVSSAPVTSVPISIPTAVPQTSTPFVTSAPIRTSLPATAVPQTSAPAVTRSTNTVTPLSSQTI